MEDTKRLSAYLSRALPGAPASAQLVPVSGGQSNPTFFLTYGDRQMVLRKQPNGGLPSAHAIDREYRVIGALAGTGVPVPALTHYCDDDEILGTPFYLMERVEGRVFADPMLPGVSPSDRRAMYFSMADTLARLHAVDWHAVGLDGYGRTEGYFERQLLRWSRQWDLSGGASSAAINLLRAWLPANVPQATTTVVAHGDFRIGNLMFHPERPEVVAVLDWELSTLGEPAADLAYSALGWHIDARIPMGMADQYPARLGIPSKAEYIAHYQAAAAAPVAIETFHTVFALFRLAVIFEGIAARARQGNASAADAAVIGAHADYLADCAVTCIDAGSEACNWPLAVTPPQSG